MKITETKRSFSIEASELDLRTLKAGLLAHQGEPWAMSSSYIEALLTTIDRALGDAWAQQEETEEDNVFRTAAHDLGRGPQYDTLRKEVTRARPFERKHVFVGTTASGFHGNGNPYFYRNCACGYQAWAGDREAVEKQVQNHLRDQPAEDGA